MNLFNIIYVPFSGVGLFDDPDDNNWLAYRIRIFKDYTLKSILNQSQKPDLLWLSFDGRKNNPLVEELVHFLKGKINVIITHDGLIYKDDKFVWRWKSTKAYQSTLAQGFRMLGRAIRKRNLKIFVRYLWRLAFKNRSLVKRLDKSLSKVRKALEFDYVYLTRLDSDDLIHKNWIKDLNRFEPKYKVSIIRCKGYVFNGKELAEWVPTTCPQFFTVCIPKRIFGDGKSFKSYWGEYISHEDADEVFMPLLGKDYQYLMLMHSNQISSVWDHPFRGQTMCTKGYLNCNSGKCLDLNDYLKDFGIT